MSGIDLSGSEPVAVASEPAADDWIPGPSQGSTTSSTSTAAADTGDRQAALRALRSLEATEARLQRNAQRDVEQARGKLIQDLLPVLDNLDRTIAAAHAGHADPAMLEGVRMVRQQLEGVLRGYGVERIDATHQPFDPSRHEAIGVIAVDDPRFHGVVVNQVEPGYQFAGKLLRPARVSVGKLIPPQVAHRPLWRYDRPL
jgi:molecular chaperone GrpE (heat shock protein)